MDLNKTIINARESLKTKGFEANYRIYFLPLGTYKATISGFSLLTDARNKGAGNKIIMTLTVSEGDFAGLNIPVSYSLKNLRATMLKLESLFRLYDSTVSIDPHCSVEEFIEYLNTSMKGSTLSFEGLKYHNKPPIINLLAATSSLKLAHSAPSDSDASDPDEAESTDYIYFPESSSESYDGLTLYEGTTDIDDYEYVQSNWEFSGPDDFDFERMGG